jgi:hypothetical protein
MVRSTVSVSRETSDQAIRKARKLPLRKTATKQHSSHSRPGQLQMQLNLLSRPVRGAFHPCNAADHYEPYNLAQALRTVTFVSDDSSAYGPKDSVAL